jgi:1,4-alpha-glucan branching enzyme
MKAKPSPRKSTQATRSADTAPEALVATPVRVLFDVHVGGAREVYLVGTFNDWHPTTLPMVDRGLGRWEKEILLPPGTHQYLLVADGRWIPDPGAEETVPNPYGGVNCIRKVS